MTDESPAKRGDAAWKEAARRGRAPQRGGAQARAGQKQSRAASVAAVGSARRCDREAEQLRELNTRISKQQARGVR